MSNWPRLRVSLASVGLGLILLNVGVFWLARDQALAGSPDFRIFYTAGLMLRRGQGGMLYDAEIQNRTQQEIAPLAVNQNGPLPYNHPPFEGLLYVAFTFLSFLAAYFVWMLLNGLLLQGVAYYLRPWLPVLSSSFPEVLILAPLGFFPAFYALMQGQDSILLLLLYALAYGALRRGKDLRAGVFLGLGLFKFHLILPFVFILVLNRRLRALAGFLVSATVLVALSWAIVGWRQLEFYPRFAWHINVLQPARVIVPENMPNLRGLLTGWNGLLPVPLWLSATLIVLSLFLVIRSARAWRVADLTNGPAWNAGFSLALFVTFLVGYHAYNQDMSLLLLPLLLMLERTLQTKAPSSSLAMRIVLSLMFFSPLYLVLTLRWSHENLFALVLLSFVWCISLSISKSEGTSQGAAVPVGVF